VRPRTRRRPRPRAKERACTRRPTPPFTKAHAEMTPSPRRGSGLHVAPPHPPRNEQTVCGGWPARTSGPRAGAVLGFLLAEGAFDAGGEGGAEVDRKSTRLNSSHVKI